MKSLVALAGALVATGLAATQPVAPRFEGRLDVLEVEVAVEVLDRDGEPVAGLTADRFEVRRGRRRLEIVGFEALHFGARPAASALARPEAAGPPPRYRRHVLLLFDLTFSNPGALARARQAAREVVLHELHPTDLVGVATFSADLGPRLLLTFTPDRAQVARALDSSSFEQRRAATAHLDPLGFLLPGLSGPAVAGSVAAFGSGDLRAEIEQIDLESSRILAHAAAREHRQYERTRVIGWARELAWLSRRLAEVPGRKQILLFSEGFDSALLLGRSNPRGEEDALGNLELQTGQIWQVDSDERFGNTQLQGEVERLLTELGRADCVVHAVDVGGLRGGAEGLSSARGTEALFHLAHGSGGSLVDEVNDLHAAIGRALRRSSQAYLLTVAATGITDDGAFHPLTVRVVGGRGLRVAHRAGFYAPRPFPELHPFEKTLLAAETIALERPAAALEVRALAAPFRSGGEEAYVPVVLEIGSRGLFPEVPVGPLPLEIYVYAIHSSGEMRDFLARRVALDDSPAAAARGLDGFKYYGHLDLAGGDYRLVALAREGRGGRTGLATLPLHVPAASARAPRLLPPFLFDLGGRWLLARESPPEGEADSLVYPFVVAGEPFVPQAAPRIRADGSPAPFLLVGYDLPAGQLRVEAALREPRGGPAPPPRVEIETSPAGSPGMAKWRGTLAATAAAPGTYLLELQVVGGDGRRVAGTTTPLTIEAGP